MKINPKEINLNDEEDDLYEDEKLVGGKKVMKTIEGLQKKRGQQEFYGQDNRNTKKDGKKMKF